MKSRLQDSANIKRLLPKRPAKAHKGQFGHVLIVAGSRGMTGAAYLSALGALKAGAGLVTVAGGRDTLKIITSRLPEAMTLPLPESSKGVLTPAGLKIIKAYVRRRTITAVAIGPGLTVHVTVRALVRSLLSLWIPTVLDADGLNNVRPNDLKDYPLIITPHAGEMARLIGLKRSIIEDQRVTQSVQLAKKLNIVCVLKGHRTVITDGKRVVLNSSGSPAMATGGMGDVLTGVIGSLLAQGLPLYEAACAGVFVHGLAGDLAKSSDRGLLASELALAIPRAFRKLGLK